MRSIISKWKKLCTQALITCHDSCKIQKKEIEKNSNYRTIAESTGMGIGTISSIKQMYCPDPKQVIKGQPRSLTTRDEIYCARLAITDKILTSTQIDKELEMYLSKKDEKCYMWRKRGETWKKYHV